MERRAGICLMLLCCLAFSVIGCGDDDNRIVSVVFDIDGTLTPISIEPYGVRPFAVQAVQSFVDRGYAVIYMTARPQSLDFLFRTSDYLRNNGYPNCPLYLSDTLLATDEATVAYKSETLDRLSLEENRIFRFGYGDSTTDFDAYNLAGIPIETTFALRRCLVPYEICDAGCKPGNYGACLMDGYEEQLPMIQSLPVVNGGYNTLCSAW